ncbi:hypothetical protein K9M16_02040 [Candidatus Babeliales bacterium]|nr:hypothetical protein [Candidatus Babeliales bacterium]
MKKFVFLLLTSVIFLKILPNNNILPNPTTTTFQNNNDYAISISLVSNNNFDRKIIERKSSITLDTNSLKNASIVTINVNNNCYNLLKNLIQTGTYSINNEIEEQALHPTANSSGHQYISRINFYKLIVIMPFNRQIDIYSGIAR